MLFLTTSIFLISCSNNEKTDNSVQTAKPNSDSVRQFIAGQLRESSNRGELIFKKNCAVCHCAPSASCEPNDGPHLINVFNDLPKDSLSYFVDYTNDSKGLKDKGDKYANQIDKKFPDNYEHGFGMTLTKQEIEYVILFIWLDARERSNGSK